MKAATPAYEEPNWSIGVGLGSYLEPPARVGLVYRASFGLNAFSSPTLFLVYRASLQPMVVFSGEARLASSNWLLVQGGFAKYGYREDSDPAVKASSTLAELTASLRHGFAESHGVQLSAYGSVGAAAYDSAMTYREPVYSFRVDDAGPKTVLTDATSSERVLLFELGAILDRRLIDGLGVRIATSLVGGSWSWNDVTTRPEDKDPVDGKSHSYEIGVHLRPSIELRMFF